jgi:glycosyltransferase involved in cell wall biosynthesis
MRPLRLLHIANSVSPSIGGPTEGIAQLGRQLKALGDHVEVACCRDTPDVPWATDFPIPVNALGPGYLRYGYSPRFVPWLKENLNRFDAVIINGLWQYAGHAAHRVLREHDKPYFVFTHGMLDPWSRQAYPFKYLKKLAYWSLVEYRLLRDASGVLFTTEEESRLAARYFPIWKWKPIVVGYGIAPSKIDRARAVRALFEAFPGLQGKRLILFLGRVHQKKGLDLLIQSFARVSRDAPDLHLLVVGDGPDRYVAKLKQLSTSLGLQDKVTWTGLLKGDQKWGALHAAELFALPSHQENFGIAVVEAMSCGKVVLISDKVNIWTEIAQDDAGLVCSDQLSSVTITLEKWLSSDRARREQMQENALQSYRRHFQVEGAAARLRQAISDALPVPAQG